MASASEDKLADLPGAELVAHLSNTYRRADFEAVARILVARDRRNAKVEAELTAALADLNAASARGREATKVKAELEDAHTGVDALREKYKALLDAFLPPGYEIEEISPMVEAAAPDAVHRDVSRVEEAKEGEVKDIDIIDLSSDEEEGERAVGGYEEEDEDEEDIESVSQRIKRLKGVNPGELESGKGDVQGQTNLVGTLLNNQQKSSSVKIEGLVATTGKMVCTPEDSKVAASLQESPVVKMEKFDGEMPRTMLLSSQVKREMSSLPSAITSNWVSEGHMVTSLLDDKNVEVNMQALCALYRQGKLATEDKRSEFRANKLAKFLLDGELHGPMKRTAEELKKQDVTNVPFLQQVTVDCSEPLFGIFRNKEDPYFC